jgi:ArpU family phage transcriptional regulator
VIQLTILNTTLTREVRRKAEKLMSRYKNIEAIIESKKLDLSTKMTVNYQPSESQRSNQFHSESERLALTQLDIEDYVLTKKKLDLVYNSLDPRQKEIWEKRYLLGQYDIDVYNDLKIPDRTYYRLKKEMILVVAEAFNLLAE